MSTDIGSPVSVFHDMARDAGSHLDAGISLDQAAAMHERDARDDADRWAAEQDRQEQAARDDDADCCARPFPCDCPF